MFDKYFKVIISGLLFLIVCGLFAISAKISDLNKTIKNTDFYDKYGTDSTRYIENGRGTLDVRIVR